MLCTNIVLNVKNEFKNIFCTQHVVSLYFSWNSMNNLSSYCWFTDSRMRASDIDLPVTFPVGISQTISELCIEKKMASAIEYRCHVNSYNYAF